MASDVPVADGPYRVGNHSPAPHCPATARNGVEICVLEPGHSEGIHRSRDWYHWSDNLSDQAIARMSPGGQALANTLVGIVDGPPTPTEPRDTEGISDEVLTDLLALVGVIVSPELMAEWTIDQRAEAANWAGAVHLHASDNDVTVPRKPTFLDADTPATPDTTEVAEDQAGDRV
ncbi:hypothetical protein [Actinocrispum wychmicini]|uniref:Uncharacterized protein n=1 Tax=Actinocrispum wychmicini TaxID=1213861 RepID=A0A4R2JC96_9PSEU|nr:hypothetical protein [Actinocrispum wychmicini]TCO57171.1 hypothetical protein EV192_106648 [Actinocrispum wychmicini]